MPDIEKVLGIESSCDETAAAVVRDGCEILSNVVSSQVEVHRPYGGVVPELASRQHIRNIVPVIAQSLEQAGVGLEDIDGVAVTRGPGLTGALLVGLQAAKAIAYVSGRPLIGVNHLEGHLCAPLLAPQCGGRGPAERHLALLVSGGHTALIMVEAFGRYRQIGASRDDAAGEALDKAAKLLGLGYPGGPVIESLARSGNPRAIRFPRALPGNDTLDFSFSGLKTSVANHVRQRGGAPRGSSELADLCASFQAAVIDALLVKVRRALRRERARSLVAAGGVIANAALREQLALLAEEEGVSLHVPPVALCTDNAAMIAAAGSVRLRAGERSDLSLNASARLPL